MLEEVLPPCSPRRPRQLMGLSRRKVAGRGSKGGEGGRRLHVLTWGRCSVCRGWSSCLVPGMSRDEDRSQRWVTWQFWRGGGTKQISSSTTKSPACSFSSLGSPCYSNLWWNACLYSQRSRYIFFFANQWEETTGIFGKAVSRARLSELQVVVHGNWFLEKDSSLGVSKEPAKPVPYQQPDNAVFF